MIDKNINAVFSSNSDEWETPQEFFELLKKEYGEFDLDPCCTKETAKADWYITKEEDGLSADWEDADYVFVNPPYSEVGKWAEKCFNEATENLRRVVLLVPSRTDTKWFHEYVLPYATEVRFVKGRLKFSNSKNSAPFPSMVVVFDYLKSRKNITQISTIGRK